VAGFCECSSELSWYWEILGITYLAEELLTSQEGLCLMKSVSLCVFVM